MATKIRSAFRVSVMALCAFSLSASAFVWGSWWRDEIALQQIARFVIGRVPTDAGIARLNDWVYRDHGFAKNHGYFLFRALGATPIQIMRSGGDCADKSRLLSAMLDSIGVRSGLVMIYPCPTCGPIHTVVDARSKHLRMVLDPIWDLNYRESARQMRHSGYASERAEHFLSRTSDPKLANLKLADTDFRYAKAINFDADAETRLVAGALRVFGIDPSRLLRPRILEDPKLLVACALSFASLLLLLACSGFIAEEPVAAPDDPRECAQRNAKRQQS